MPGKFLFWNFDENLLHTNDISDIIYAQKRTISDNTWLYGYVIVTASSSRDNRYFPVIKPLIKSRGIRKNYCLFRLSLFYDLLLLVNVYTANRGIRHLL